MSDLIDFLLARIAEDEVAARAALERGSAAYDSATLRDRGFILADSTHIPRWKPSRVLTECAVKRTLITVTRRWMDTGHITLDVQLRHLALPYADHPDYRAEEWRP